jgi:thiamine biosynthesis lipoprotein
MRSVICRILTTGACLVLAGAVARAQQPARPARHLAQKIGEAMGTDLRFAVLTDDDARAQAAMQAAFDEVKRIEALMTTWRPDSEVSRVNAQAGVAPVRVSDETLEVVLAAERASRLSNGAFDITFYAMKGLWKFDEDLEPKLPDPKELAKRRALIDWRKVIVDQKAKTIFLAKRGMAINLGGIAKGYAVDRAAAVLKRAGFPDAIVQAGGDLLCAGSKEGQPWTAGIRDPRGPRDDVFAVLKLTDHAFSTAGDYERFFVKDGKRYHHIIDPKTGYPATRARSVTIYAPTALLADALDDAVFIMGWEKGLAMIEKLDDVGAVVIDADGGVHISKRMQGRVQIVHPPKPGI